MQAMLLLFSGVYNLTFWL